MFFEPQTPYVPDLTGIPQHTTPDWDELKSQPTDPAVDYALLRRMQYLRPAQVAAIQARGHIDVIEIVIVVEPGVAYADVVRTRESLAYQAHDRLVVTMVDTSTQRLEDYLCATEHTWVWIVYAGDMLAPYAALIASDAMACNPEMVAHYSDEEQRVGNVYSNPFYKPDLSLEWLRASPYVGRGVLVRSDIYRELAIEAFSHVKVAAYEIILRVVEKSGRYAVGHLRETLYQSPVSYNNWLADTPVTFGAANAVKGHLARLKIDAITNPGLIVGSVRIKYPVTGFPMVSIIIPVKDQVPSLRRLFDILVNRTTWRQYEIVIVAGYSLEPGFVGYLSRLSTAYPGKVRIVNYVEPFNYAKMLQSGVEASKGEYLTFLHADMQITQDDWLETLLGYAQCQDVAMVGTRLVYPQGLIQHAGVTLGIHGVAAHSHYKQGKDTDGCMGRLKLPQDVSAVTGVGSFIRRDVFDEIGGFDTDNLPLVYHDVDLSVRIVQAGYRIVWTPYVTHLTDDNALAVLDTTHKSFREKRIKDAMHHMREKALQYLAHDPYHHPHLTLMDTYPSNAFRSSLAWSPFRRPALTRIFTFPGDKSGCGFYRTRGPLDAMIAEGKVEGIASEWMPPVTELARLNPDSLIFQRKIDEPQLHMMADYQRYLPNMFSVYELDDLLHAIPPKSIHYGQFPQDVFDRMVRGVKSCNRLVVSTQPLADAFAEHHRDIVVRQNRLIPRYWRHIQAQRIDSPLPRVGWGGGSSHRGDLEMIETVIKHFHGRVQWVFFGMLPDVLKPYVREFHSSVKIEVYPQMMASLNLDLALAPVEDNEFNRCKSSLRVLEYGACGYAVIASDVEAYRTPLPVTLVSSDPKEWIDAIDDHLKDLDVCHARGQALRAAIHQDWFLEGKHVDDWMAAWLP